MKVRGLVSFVAHTYPECLGVPWSPPGEGCHALNSMNFSLLLRERTLPLDGSPLAGCALGSLSIMGGVQVKIAGSEHLAGSDCGDKYSNTVKFRK